MNRKIARLTGLLALIALASISPLIAAESGGVVTGSVLDGRHNPVSAMTVRATDVVDPSKVYNGLADTEGKFTIPGLPAGSYLVSAETLNTAWIQKDDSPIVEVSSSSSPVVTLILVKANEMSPAAVSGGDDDGLHVATLGLASLATAGAVVALINQSNLESDHDDLVEDHFEIMEMLTLIRGDINDLYQLINQRIPASPRR